MHQSSENRGEGGRAVSWPKNNGRFESLDCWGSSHKRLGGE